ncbi:MAG TPA: tetratricopeptide repeat protein [Pyrinomonadaceae bacterium]|nr:tetratricopeptide repeat protein [Pyrinomonadaceae bacterium]
MSTRNYFWQLLFLIAASVLLPGGLLHAQDPAGGGTFVRDIMGGAALVFRRPDNPDVEIAGRVGGGKLSERRSARQAAVTQEQLIARGNAARNAATPRYSEAEEQYRLAARRQPKDVRAYAGLGNVYLDQNRFVEAVVAYQQAAKVRPDYLPVYMPLAYSLVRINRYTEALEVYKQLLTLTPDDPELHNNVGFTYNQLEQYNDSIPECQQAIKLLSGTGQSYQMGLQNRNEVLGYSYKNLGNALNGLKRYEEAIVALKQATTIDPNSAAAFFNLGLAHYSAGQNAEAVDAYKKVLKLKPGLPAVHFNLGLAYVALHNETAALEEYETLKGLNANLANQLYSFIKQ